MTVSSVQTSVLPQPAIVLVRPQMGENIGAAARAMLNFGLTRMRVVAARDGWPSPQAVAMASGAGRVLDAAQHFDDLPQALSDCSYVYATTARPRDLTKTVLTPKEAMQDAHARIAAGQRVAVMFGPERAGLANDDVIRANAIVTVPANPDYSSLNLAQCVLLMGYEWAQGGHEDDAAAMQSDDTATQEDVEKLSEHFEAVLDEAGFFFPQTKAAPMKMNLRNLWSRMPLMRADVQMLHGILRQMVRWKNRSAGGAASPDA